jgi:hypothetical protein
MLGWKFATGFVGSCCNDEQEKLKDAFVHEASALCIMQMVSLRAKEATIDWVDQGAGCTWMAAPSRT